MALPGDLTTTIVTGSFVDVAGTPLQGTITFAPTSNLTDSTGKVVVPATGRRYILSGGTFTSDPLVSTDNTTLSPPSWAYIVTIAPQDITAYSVTVSIPHSPSPVDLSVLAPALSAVTYASYMPLSGGTFLGPVYGSESPVGATELATKGYVDTATTGLDAKPAVQEATTAALAANTYNGTAMTLTATANGALTVDGVTVAVNDRVLVKNEAAQANNGIYSVTQAGSGSLPYILTRAQDMNAPSEIPGAFALVEHGTANADTGWFVASPGPFTLGTTAIVWAYQSGGLVLDTTDNALPLGTAGPGSTGKAADAGHVHPNTSVINGVTVSGTPALNKTIICTSGTAATWQAADEIVIDSNPADIQPLAASASAGSVMQAADAGHAHPFTSNIGPVAVSGSAASGRVPIATSSSAAAWTLPLQIDTTATDIQPLGTRSAGVLTQAAAADHIHASTSIIDGVTVSGTPVAGEVMVATSGSAATWQVPQGQLTPTAVKTSAYAANPLDFVPVDTTSGSVTVTLPNAPGNLTVLGVKLIILAGANTVTIAASGSDVFNKASGSTTLSLTRALQTVVLLYHSGIWYVTATDAAISIDTTAGDIAALGAQAAGSTAKAADAGHVHPTTGLVLTSSLPLAIASGGTGQGTQQAGMDALAGAVTSGDYLRGSGSHVVMSTIQAADLPAGTTSTKGALQLDGTATDIAAVGTQAAGSTGKAADAGHIHPSSNVVAATTSPTTTVTLANTAAAAFASTAGGAYTITLGSAVTCGAGVMQFITKTTTDTNTLSIAASGGQSIGGTTTSYALYASGDRLQVMSDGTNWQVIQYQVADLLLTASQTFTVPGGWSLLEAIAIGGGAGGGGGGSTSTSAQAQVGGAGGGAGGYTSTIVPVTAATALTVTIGTGGSGGAGGASGSHGGVGGGAGVDTAVSGTGVSLTAKGGGATATAGASSTSGVSPGIGAGNASGAVDSNSTTRAASIPGAGGVAQDIGGAGGSPLGPMAYGGGGGGAPATSGSFGGVAGNLAVQYVASFVSGNTGVATGGNASNATAAMYGAGGAGGGGGATGGAGGNGGNGGPGLVVLRRRG